MTEYIRLKESNCKSCYKCIRHCPVKSISFSGDQAHIIPESCILCGECFLICPQNAKQIRSDVQLAKALISGPAPVVASLAPSFAACFPEVGIEGMRQALKRLGFDDVEETAIGATIVKKEYENIVARGEQNVIISTCCPTVNLMVRKHFPEALPYLADVVSPMNAHCMDIKRRRPEAKTVFIGPCISKKQEGDECEAVDCVLTFEELTEWLKEENIEPVPCMDVTAKSRARLFPTPNGIIKTMDKPESEYSYISIDGHENCIAALRDIISGKVNKCFVEMSACSGSCVCGPAMSRDHHYPVSGAIKIFSYAGKDDFDVAPMTASELLQPFPPKPDKEDYPSERQLTDILNRMGKFKPEDELNCGSCGYNSCREKAIAVFQGKADLSMCTPFLRDKAETFSNNILRNSPNGILVLSDELEIQQINPAAMSILNVKGASSVVGEQVVKILDPRDFLHVSTTGQSIHNKRIYLPEYKRHVEETIVHDRVYHSLLCILRDVTEEEQQRAQREDISRRTMEITDKVVEKQMRVVQDIASLLGETTAETKIALTKLKESLKNE